MAHDFGIMIGNQVREFLVFVCIYTSRSLPNGLISFFPPDKRKNKKNLTTWESSIREL